MTTQETKDNNENFSTDAAFAENSLDESGDETMFNDSASKEDSPEQVIAQMEAQLTEMKDRELKTQAEFDNYRKRLARDTEQTLKYSALPLVRDILEVADNLNRAADAAQNTPEAASLLAGVKMVQQQLKSVLEKYHCKAIESLGKPFDPNIHQAIAQSPSPDYPAGTISLEASTGYMMHDRVIRPSHVIVSTGNPQAN